MDVRTRVKLAKFSEEIRRHPETALSMGVASDMLPKHGQKQEYHGECAKKN